MIDTLLLLPPPPPLLLLLRRAGHLSSTAHIQQRGPHGDKITPPSAPFCSSDVRGRHASRRARCVNTVRDCTDMEFYLRETSPSGFIVFRILRRRSVKHSPAVLRLRGRFGGGPSEGGELS